jgi:transcriptional regulator with XRE-family HTH domain
MRGQQIQEKRLELGLSQVELAEKFGIDLDLLKDWETGKITPSNPKILEYAFLGLESDFEFDEETLATIERVRNWVPKSFV